MVETFSSFISYVLSLAFGAGGSFCSATGLISMKIANIRVEGKANRFLFLKQPLWWLGLLILMCSICFNGRKFQKLLDYNLRFYSFPFLWEYNPDVFHILFFHNLYSDSFSHYPWRKVFLESRWHFNCFDLYWVLFHYHTTTKLSGRNYQRR